MMIMRGASRLLAGLVFAFALHCAAATAETTIPLPTVTKTVVIEGLSIEIPIRPEATFGNGLVKLKATVSLAGLQQQAAAILQALAARKSSCKTRWSFPELAVPAVSNGRLRVSGKVRVELWICDVIKTKLGRETADFTLALFPQVAPDQLLVRAELERFDLGQSLLGDLGLEDEVRKKIEAELSKALAGGASVAFPPEIAALNPKFTGAELKDNAGTAEIVATAEAPASAATILTLIQLFT